MGRGRGLLMKQLWNGYELLATATGDGIFVWGLWKKAGKSSAYKLTKGFPSGSEVLVERGYFDEVVYDYQHFLDNVVKQHTKENR